MSRTGGCGTDVCGELDWLHVVRCLAARARRRHVPLPRAELGSLAGLAVAKARVYYDPARATCSLRLWIYSQGWRLMLAEIRNEFRRRRRAGRDVTFTDLEGPSASVESGRRSCIQMLLIARRDAAIVADELTEGLPAADRGIIILRLHHWTLQQIAVKYGVSREAIRLRLVKLRRVMAPQARPAAGLTAGGGRHHG